MSAGIICYGASVHAKVVADIIRQTNGRLAAFIDDDPAREGERIEGVTVLGPLASLSAVQVRDARFIVTIGVNEARLRAAASLEALGAAFATAVHPRACVAPDVRLGTGTVVMAGGIINPGASIGSHVIVNTGATVDHDCVLEDGVHVSPGANLAGGVHVGRACHIGTGAVVIPGVRIAAGSTVGAGAVVIRNVEAACVVVGNPAREIGKNRGSAE